MEKVIEKLLKEKIGTSFVYEDDKGFKVFKLTRYGREILIICDVETKDSRSYTRVIYPDLKVFIVDLEQDQPNFETFFVASVKMMIEMRKKVKPNVS